jgi:hypothetical protein
VISRNSEQGPGDDGTAYVAPRNGSKADFVRSSARSA